MPALFRGSGLTDTERYLAQLADRTFLRLWSYPNPFFQKQDGYRVLRKELADLLVVCGDDVLIFSDKAIAWPTNQSPAIAWKRWYRQAIEKSISQIRGAERQLAQYPHSIFLDTRCTQKFPIDIPTINRRRVHGIIVATGVTDVVREFYDELSGTFPIRANLKGSDHVDEALNISVPFSFGDVNPSGSFVHVFDPSALDMLMAELDTVADLVDYLTKRGNFIRSGRFLGATGEEDLLAFFLQNLASDGSHEFITPEINRRFPGRTLFIGCGEYRSFIQSNEYRQKKEADRVSYIWDKLIDVFVKHVVDGTAVKSLEHEPDATFAERALRFMATETRVHRRLLGAAVYDALHKAQAPEVERFVKTLVPDASSNGPRVGYIILVRAFPKHQSSCTYDLYRKERLITLQFYCLNLLAQVDNIDIAVGVALDSAPDFDQKHAGSEDLVALERPIWTEELLDWLEEGRQALNVTPISSASRYKTSTYEYPSAKKRALSRQQRRAEQRAHRKAARTRVSR